MEVNITLFFADSQWFIFKPHDVYLYRYPIFHDSDTCDQSNLRYENCGNANLLERL